MSDLTASTGSVTRDPGDKCRSIVLEALYKLTECILQARVKARGTRSARPKFNFNIPELVDVRKNMVAWRRSVFTPLTLEIRWRDKSAGPKAQEVLLERWLMQYEKPKDVERSKVDSDRLRQIYKEFAVLLRSLHSLLRVLPAHSVAKRQSSGLIYRVLAAHPRLKPSRYGATFGDVSCDEVDFAPITTPYGVFKLGLKHREDITFTRQPKITRGPTPSILDNVIPDHFGSGRGSGAGSGRRKRSVSVTAAPSSYSRSSRAAPTPPLAPSSSASGPHSALADALRTTDSARPSHSPAGEGRTGRFSPRDAVAGSGPRARRHTITAPPRWLGATAQPQHSPTGSSGGDLAGSVQGRASSRPINIGRSRRGSSSRSTGTGWGAARSLSGGKPVAAAGWSSHHSRRRSTSGEDDGLRHGTPPPGLGAGSSRHYTTGSSADSSVATLESPGSSAVPGTQLPGGSYEPPGFFGVSPGGTPPGELSPESGRVMYSTSAGRMYGSYGQSPLGATPPPHPYLPTAHSSSRRRIRSMDDTQSPTTEVTGSLAGTPAKGWSKAPAEAGFGTPDAATSVSMLGTSPGTTQVYTPMGTPLDTPPFAASSREAHGSMKPLQLPTTIEGSSRPVNKPRGLSESSQQSDDGLFVGSERDSYYGSSSRYNRGRTSSDPPAAGDAPMKVYKPDLRMASASPESYTPLGLRTLPAPSTALTVPHASLAGAPRSSPPPGQFNIGVGVLTPAHAAAQALLSESDGDSPPPSQPTGPVSVTNYRLNVAKYNPFGEAGGSRMMLPPPISPPRITHDMEIQMRPERLLQDYTPADPAADGSSGRHAAKADGNAEQAGVEESKGEAGAGGEEAVPSMASSVVPGQRAVAAQDKPQEAAAVEWMDESLAFAVEAAVPVDEGESRAQQLLREAEAERSSIAEYVRHCRHAKELFSAPHPAATAEAAVGAGSGAGAGHGEGTGETFASTVHAAAAAHLTPEMPWMFSVKDIRSKIKELAAARRAVDDAGTIANDIAAPAVIRTHSTDAQVIAAVEAQRAM